MKPAIRLALLCAALSCAAPSQARQNSVPSCYAANQMEQAVPAPQRALFLLIDETTVFNPALQAAAWNAVAPLVVPGTTLTVVRFSAFSQARYTTTSFSGALEEGVAASARHAISVKKLKLFDECLKGQQAFVVKKVQAAMAQAFGNASSDLVKSDVIAAMSDVAVSVHAGKAAQKIVFVMSDMLENSAIGSFYEAKGVRRVDPAAEMAKVSKAGMIGDFDNARIWVMGAGIVAADKAGGKGVYRDPVRLKALQNFWSDYFKQSKGSLVEFGTPELKQPIR